MAQTEQPVQMHDVVARYGNRTALDQIRFALEPGVTGLLGPNGAGKSTLLRILATVQQPSAGHVSWFGLTGATARELHDVRLRLGYMPQAPGYYPGFRVEDFVHHFALLKEIGGRARRKAEVTRVLEAVRLADRRSSRVKALSGGMRQRLALACAILGEPDLIVLDEPTVGLDPEQRAAFREIVASLGQTSRVLLSTHQTDDVAAVCGRVLVLADGQIRFTGTPAELTEQATGRVWTGSEREPGAVAGWTTGAGIFRNIGTPPASATVLPPTIDDGYLIVAADTGSSAVAR